ncbi:hypothetical protein M9H77_13804 [Catharanthus roseus]|uniref:Uncharacterized protein n=1 Tax=Catharanthus roseus TaxID=4058 RepID=A0ACC0BLD8_CATRO|nr:hypothetical protein M9H77_13804 [Catharanthus roseus]
MATFMSQKFNKYWNCYIIVLSFAIILDPRYKLSHVNTLFRYLNYNTIEAKYMQAPNTCLPTFDTRGSFNEGDIVVDDMDLYGNTSSKSQLDLYLDEALMLRGKRLDVTMMTIKMMRVRRSPLTLKIEFLNSTLKKLHLNFNV